MENLHSDNFDILVTVNDNLITMLWKGQSGSKNADQIITNYLRNFVTEIPAGHELVIRFNDLEYFNSTSITPILEFFSIMNSRKVPTKVYYNKQSFYQNMSFKPLQAVVARMANVEMIGE